VHDVDRVANVELLKSLRLMSCVQRVNGISRHRGERRNFRQQPAVGPTEFQLSIGVSLDRVPLLVDGAVVSTTEQSKIRERRGAPVSPVSDVMTLAEP